VDDKAQKMVLPEKQLAISRDVNELIYVVANMMNLGYVPDEEGYITEDGYECQPMILKGAENGLDD